MLFLAHNRPRAISGPFLALALVFTFIFLMFFVWWLRIRQDESEGMKDTEAAQTPPTTKDQPKAEDEEGEKMEDEGTLGVEL